MEERDALEIAMSSRRVFAAFSPESTFIINENVWTGEGVGL